MNTSPHYELEIPIALLQFLAVILIVVLFLQLGSWGVLDTSEARYAEIAREMHASGDYLHPVYLGIEHYHKPPFTYWVTSFSYTLFGVSPFAARFFLQVALLLQLLLVFSISRIMFRKESWAWQSVLIYASMLIVWISVRNLTTDAYLNTWLLACFWALLRYVHRDRVDGLYLAALFAGLGFLTKITAVFVYLGPFVLSLLWLERKRIRFSWHMILATLLFAAVAGSWFILLQAEGKPVLRYVLYDQSVVRYTTDEFNRSMPVYFYLLAAPLLAFPWLLMLVQSVLRLPASSGEWSKYRWFFLIWTILPILFFSLSRSKLILYILPAFWSIALLLPRFQSLLTERTWRRWYRIFLVWMTFMLLALPLIPWFAPQYDLSNDFWGTYIIVLLTMGGLIWYIRAFQLQIRLPVMAMGFALGLVLITAPFLAANQLVSSTAAPVAEWIEEEGLQEYQVYVFDKLAPSLSFHLQRMVPLIGRRVTRELDFEDNEGWKQYYYDLSQDERRKSLFKALEEPSLLLVRSRRVSDVDSEIRSYFDEDRELGIWTVLIHHEP